MRYSKLAASLVIGASLVLSSSAMAQSHRQKTKNDWRNIAYASGALGALGLLKGDGTLTTLGTLGALYSVNRYEQDRRSQSSADRQRAAMYRRGWFNSNGHHYVRKTVWRHGQKHYAFVRTS